jgi:hypothetical protein
MILKKRIVHIIILPSISTKETCLFSDVESQRHQCKLAITSIRGLAGGQCSTSTEHFNIGKFVEALTIPMFSETHPGLERCLPRYQTHTLMHGFTTPSMNTDRSGKFVSLD